MSRSCSGWPIMLLIFVKLWSVSWEFALFKSVLGYGRRDSLECGCWWRFCLLVCEQSRWFIIQRRWNRWCFNLLSLNLLPHSLWRLLFIIYFNQVHLFSGYDFRVELEAESGSLRTNVSCVFSALFLKRKRNSKWMYWFQVIEKFPHIGNYKSFKVPSDLDIRDLVKSQLAVVCFDCKSCFPLLA